MENLVLLYSSYGLTPDRVLQEVGAYLDHRDPQDLSTSSVEISVPLLGIYRGEISLDFSISIDFHLVVDKIYYKVMELDEELGDWTSISRSQGLSLEMPLEKGLDIDDRVVYYLDQAFTLLSASYAQ